MQSQSETPKKVPRKHLTTACVPCRESKIRCDGATPYCNNCERKGKTCKYQHGEDKRKVSLRPATELFSARIDQLCQFIYDNGLEPPPMNPEDESGMNRVLETLRIPRKTIYREHVGMVGEQDGHPQTAISGVADLCLPAPLTSEGHMRVNESTTGVPLSSPNLPSDQGFNPSSKSPESINALGMNLGPARDYSSSHWALALPTAESFDALCANMIGGPGVTPDGSVSPASFHPLRDSMQQQPGESLGQPRDSRDYYDSDSGEEDEAEKDVIEQLSHRIGTLKIAGDGHLRFYGATSNLNLVDVSATQQRQRPDARSIRHDGQDILNHLRVGQPVDPVLEDHLVELYFTWQNPSTYVVDKEMFMIARSRWRNGCDDTPFYSEVLTNAMCAIGSAFEARYHPTFITFPKSLSEFFADRAKALLEIELDSPCVATVQALVILSCHEGSSNRDARGWLYSGMSMRLAFDLGLHLDMTVYVERGDISAIEADVRRVAFWGSYIADHFWGFYLGRPFRMNAGDITVMKPASDLGHGRESIWYPYGHLLQSEALKGGIMNPNELISRQFVILWEIISPVGHILYGCSDIPKHELQRLCHPVTDDLFAWRDNLPSNLDIDLENDTVPILPHLLMLHLQYHQIVIFTHRPWVSKSYIQPRAPRQGPGYHHARRMCIQSSMVIARLLHIYEKHYTFRRMNNQVVAIIFSAALMLLYVTISNSSPTKSSSTTTTSTGSETPTTNAEMVAYLNLCFRALDELGQSFENAKRTRDFLVSLQRRWQAHMRRSGPRKRQITNRRSSQTLHATDHTSSSRKKSRVAPAAPQTIPPVPQEMPAAKPTPLPQSLDATQQFGACQPGDLDWIRTSDLQFLSEQIVDGGVSAVDRVAPYGGGGSGGGGEGGAEFPTVSDFGVGPWWDSPGESGGVS